MAKSIIIAILLISIIISSVKIFKLKKNKGMINKSRVIIIFVLIIFLIISILWTFVDLDIDSDSMVEKWNNKRSHSNIANKDVITYLFDGVKNNDVQKISNMFSEETRNKSNFQNELTLFFENVPKDIYEYSYKNIGTYNPKKYDFTKITENLSSTYILQKEDKIIYLYFSGYTVNDEGESKIGLEKLYLQSAQAKILENEELDDANLENRFIGILDKSNSFRYPKNYESEYVIDDEKIIDCIIAVDENFELKIIKNQPYRYNYYERNISKDELINSFKQSNKTEDLIKLLGNPNSISYYSREIIYEVSDINNMIYAFIEYSGTYDLINCTFFDLDGNYIEKISK